MNLTLGLKCDIRFSGTYHTDEDMTNKTDDKSK